MELRLGSVRNQILSPTTQIVAVLESARVLYPEAFTSQRETNEQIIYLNPNVRFLHKAEEQELIVQGADIDSFSARQTPNSTTTDYRYGQSNEIGQLRDYGYDNPRDMVLVLTLLSSIFIIPFCYSALRKRRELSALKLGKGLSFALSVPLVVHLLGNFMVNNFGGLGGGL